MTTQVRHLRVVEAAEPWMSKRDLPDYPRWKSTVAHRREHGQR